MIVTEETHAGNNLCTMETGRAGAEDPVFGQPGAANEVEATRIDAAQVPGTWPGNTTGSVSRLSKSTHTVGPNSLQKVMAGDNLSATVQYYYQGSATNTSSNSLANDIANNLVSVISNSAVTSIATKGGAAAIGANLSGTPPFASITDPNQNTTDNLPRAYLSVIFFDERFNFVSENSTVVRVNSNTNSSLTIPNVAAPKNGYAYIYLSNESDIPVYFDNFNVSNTRGRIIEENHYYAYGLKIAGISSKKLGDPNEGSLKNNYLYNDKEIDDEGDLNWEDYGFRNYDPQIGRFVQIDPLVDETPALSGYHYALNDPITNIDEDGLSALSPVQQVACWTGQSAALVGLMNTLRTVEQIASISVNVAKIAGDYGNYRSTDNQIGNVLNGQTPKQVGGDNGNKFSLNNNSIPHDYDKWSDVDKTIYKVLGAKPLKYRTPNDKDQNEGDIASSLQDKYSSYHYKSPPNEPSTTDCSDFTERVAKRKGYYLKPEGAYGNSKAVGQANWYKNHGKWLTDLKQAKKGDHIFWDRGTDESGVLYHTGVISEIDKDGTIWVTQSQTNHHKAPTIHTNKLNSSGQMRGFTKLDSTTPQSFVGLGRYP